MDLEKVVEKLGQDGNSRPASSRATAPARSTASLRTLPSASYFRRRRRRRPELEPGQRVERRAEPGDSVN